MLNYKEPMAKPYFKRRLKVLVSEMHYKRLGQSNLSEASGKTEHRGK